MYKLLFTFQKEAARLAKDEMKRFGVVPVKMVSDEVCLGETDADMFTFPTPALRATPPRRGIGDDPPVFVRHICPVNAILSWDDSAEMIYSRTMSIVGDAHLGVPNTIGIQARTAADISSKPKGVVLDAIHKAVDDSGATRAHGTPDFALSVLFTADEIMMGISPASLNLSTFAGGNRSFARTDDMISRSEFKLLEAFEVFSLTPKGGRALDLGAAPGGWSRILAGKGYNVVAVDPADLDARLASNERIEHKKITAQQYLSGIQNSTIKFDILANDMKMESSLSARLVSQFAENLKPDGIVILTLKLLPGKFLRQIHNARMILEPRFDIIGIRQLFHNRSEVTVCARPKTGAVSELHRLLDESRADVKAGKKRPLQDVMRDIKRGIGDASI